MDAKPFPTVPNNEYFVTHYIKKYPDRLKVILFKTPYSSYVLGNKEKKISSKWIQSEDKKLDSKDQSLQRAKTRITDLTLCNVFDLFVTFTFNCRACIPKCNNKPCTCEKDTCKRYDLDYVIRTQKGWYNNQIKKYGRFPYVQVMELHKDRGYHFHALFKGYLGNVKYWKTDPKDRRPIYRITSNRKGWTTVKKIYDISGTSSYIRKYITKDMPLFHGKKRFWVSQGLLRPIVIQDELLMKSILENPDSQVWVPNEGYTVRENNTFKSNNTNLDSITTLYIDNKDEYLNELGHLKKIEETVKRLNKESTA